MVPIFKNSFCVLCISKTLKTSLVKRGAFFVLSMSLKPLFYITPFWYFACFHKLFSRIIFNEKNRV